MRHAQLIAALQFICTEYGLDKENPREAGEPHGERLGGVHASNRGEIALNVPKDDAMERLSKGDVKSPERYPPE